MRYFILLFCTKSTIQLIFYSYSTSQFWVPHFKCTGSCTGQCHFRGGHKHTAIACSSPWNSRNKGKLWNIPLWWIWIAEMNAKWLWPLINSRFPWTDWWNNVCSFVLLCRKIAPCPTENLLCTTVGYKKPWPFGVDCDTVWASGLTGGRCPLTLTFQSSIQQHSLQLSCSIYHM